MSTHAFRQRMIAAPTTNIALPKYEAKRTVRYKL